MANNQLPADLEDFVSKEVASLCDADPAVLAQYIIALIGNEERNDALKANLQSQLNEFFDDQTIPFIDRLFAKINNSTKKSGEERFRGDYSDEEDDGDRNFKHRRQRSDSRDEEHERSYKRRSDDYEHNGSHHHTKYQRGSGASPNSIPVSGYNSPSYDARRGPNHRTVRGGRPTTGGRGQTRPQCRDYNEKGFCMRGDLCPYDHGMDRIIVDEGGVPPFPNVPFANASVAMGRPKPPFFGMSDAYDPERSGLVPGHDMNYVPGHDVHGGMVHRGRGRGGSGGVGRGGYQRHLHQNKNPQNTTLVVEKIPVENCQISTVNDYFAKFGTITNISVQPQAQKAIIQYSTRAEAEKAYSSPDVIFDNRFVKVYWSKEDTHGAELPATTPTAPPKTTPAITEPDPELVAKRAAEIAAAREEKQKKHQEHMKHILELQKKRETQLQQQIDEQKRLLAKLTDSANMSTAEKAELLKALKKIQSDIDISKQAAAHAEQDAKEAPAETTEDLKKKLARLEAEAAHLGIHTAGGFRGGRGGYYGRGRGSWPRMRGGMTRMTLDNRPTKIHITSIPEASTETELRQHFEQFGHVTLFEQKENEADVQYSQRFEAEKAMSLGPNYPKGSLELAWSTNLTESNQTTTEES
ncbi:uncharacterized protein B0P05DRAFT_530835 [Gilbertella persicaria]|uniref:uncharacterized protein n=1 Tax=Gilbertella persicaria TaxID=101096 RepID=UPI0022211818|nr:uncharacterized protein B0P05DRAFT_530835 [Gilbertella persicaria]KAI8087958.1 hypothetical protein B0P05DRAFT_530835 [Gilbertella persicaria]